MMTRRTLLGRLAGAATLLHPASSFAFSTDDSLKTHAEKHGLLTGTAVDVRTLRSNADYRRLLSEQHDILVAENQMKWRQLRPTADTYSFNDADALVTFAQEHKMQLRGHNLVWHNSLPDWFQPTVTKDNAQHFLVDHILTVGRHFAGKVQSWDVVNEAVQPTDKRPDGLRNSPWMQLLGPDYLDLAFRTARQADPHALLTYNDYGIENDSDESSQRRAAMLSLLRHFQAQKVPIDAVGIQSHIHANPKHPIGKKLSDFLSTIAGMGLEIYITELDVNDDDVEGSIADRDRIVADTYRQYLDLVLQQKAVKAVLTWGTDDGHTWLNSTDSHKKKQPNRATRPLPFDAQLQPKPAFFAIRGAFDRAPSRKPTRSLP